MSIAVVGEVAKIITPRNPFPDALLISFIVKMSFLIMVSLNTIGCLPENTCMKDHDRKTVLTYLLRNLNSREGDKAVRKRFDNIALTVFPPPG